MTNVVDVVDFTDFGCVPPYEVEHPRQNVVVVGFVQKTEEVKRLKATREVKKYILNYNEKKLAGRTGLNTILIILYTTSIRLWADRRGYLYQYSTQLPG